MCVDVWNKSILRSRVYVSTFYSLLPHEILSLLRKRQTLNPYPDHMVDGVNVTVAGVHPDGPQREAKLLS